MALSRFNKRASKRAVVAVVALAAGLVFTQGTAGVAHATQSKISPDAGPTIGGTVTTIDGDFDAIDKLAVGLDHTLALMSNGNLYAWGDNSGGSFGDGTTTNSTTGTDWKR